MESRAMPRLVSCPACREDLSIPEEFFGQSVRCAACSHVFIAGGERAVVASSRRDEDDDLPTRRGDNYEADQDHAAPPRRSRRGRDDREPRQRSGRSGLFWLFAMLGGLFSCCGVSCVGLLLFGLWVDNPKLIPYDAPDSTFRAAFPGPVIAASTKDELGQTKSTYEHSRKFLQDTYFVHVVELKSKPKPGEEADVLDEAADRYLNYRPGSTQNLRFSTSTQGYPAVEMEIEHPDDTSTFVRLILVDKRLYYVGVSGRGLVPESQRIELFWGEFQLKPTEGQEAAAGEKPTRPSKRPAPVEPIGVDPDEN